MRKSIYLGELKVSYLEKNPEKDLTILFLHGNSQAATTFHRQMNSPELSGFRLLAMDLPGHGLSDRNKNYSIPMLVKAITDFVTKLGLTNFVLAGQSLGGHLALQALSVIHPAGIFLSGTPPLSIPLDSAGFRAHPQFGLFYTLNVMDSELELLLNDLYTTQEERVAGKFEFLQTDSAFRPALLASIGAGEFQDEVLAWEEFQGQKNILIGSHDLFINFESVQTKIPDTIIVNGGHNLQLETESYTDLLSQMMLKLNSMNQISVSEESLNG